MAKPILILSPGRSGSSLVAGIFAKHGVWTGNCHPGNKYNPEGYFENIAIQRAMQNHFGRDWLGNFPQADDVFPHMVKSIMAQEGYTDGA